MSERPSWLTAEALWKGAGALLTAAGLYYGIAHRVDALGTRVEATNDRVIELSTKVEKIQASLPNREADKLVVDGIDKRVAKLEQEYDKVDTYIQTMRERLAEHGWKP